MQFTFKGPFPENEFEWYKCRTLDQIYCTEEYFSWYRSDEWRLMALVLLLFKHLMGKFRHFHKTKLQQEWYIYSMTAQKQAVQSL